MRRMRSGLVLGLVMAAAAALAMPTFQTIVQKEFPAKKDGAVAKAACALCHASKTSFKKLNAYGQDLAKILATAKTKALTPALLHKADGLDSDKDGVKNADELKKDTLPGDPKSK